LLDGSGSGSGSGCWLLGSDSVLGGKKKNKTKIGFGHAYNTNIIESFSFQKAVLCLSAALHIIIFGGKNENSS